MNFQRQQKINELSHLRIEKIETWAKRLFASGLGFRITPWAFYIVLLALRHKPMDYGGGRVGKLYRTFILPLRGKIK